MNRYIYIYNMQSSPKMSKDQYSQKSILYKNVKKHGNLHLPSSGGGSCCHSFDQNHQPQGVLKVLLWSLAKPAIDPSSFSFRRYRSFKKISSILKHPGFNSPTPIYPRVKTEASQHLDSSKMPPQGTWTPGSGMDRNMRAHPRES